MMETPKGRRVKMTKLGGPRWRLEMGVHQIFISKEGPGTARLEHLNEDLIGNYPVWDQAMGEALRMFDKWEDATMPPPETYGLEDRHPGCEVHEDHAEPQRDPAKTPRREPLRYHVVWSGRSARECTTTVMEYVDKEYWDNVFFVTLLVVDWPLRRIVHTIDVPIDEESGWRPNEAFERIGVMIEQLEQIIATYEDDLERGAMTWESIQI
jgi:hypothetical protein